MGSILGCVGKTSIEHSHPLVVSAAAGPAAKVYFIRRNPGFRGVMDMPVTISVEGAPLLKLAKGQYTLLALPSGTFDATIESYTVDGTGAMTRVTTRGAMTLSSDRTYYFLFELASRPFEWIGSSGGSRFLPVSVPRETALEVTHELTPVGLAIDEPISPP